MQEHEQLKMAFTQAYDEFIDAMFRYFAFRLGDRERALELAQETFMRVWKYAASGNEIHNMKAFLYTTAGNLFKNELRSKRDVVSLDALMEVSAFEPTATGMAAETASEIQLLIRHVHDLKPEYRDIALMRYVDGLEVGDIARILDISAIAASVRIHRATAKLRAIYEKL